MIGRRLAKVVGAVERRLWPRSPVILIYHRIADPARDLWGLAVSPEAFTEQIEALKSVRDVVSLAELTRRSREGRGGGRPLAAITFDDGYHDAFSAARPILRRLDCPATVFVAAGLVDAGREFWWDKLEFIFLQTRTLPPTLPADLARADRPNALPDAAARRGACHGLRRQFRDLTPAAIEARLAGLRAWAGVGRPARDEYRAMTAGEVAELNDGLVTVGAHTMTHPSLPRLTARDQQLEIGESRRRCEALIGAPVTEFAYPFGHYDAASLAAAREAGFSCACATTPGVVRPWSDPFALPRLAPGRMDGEALLGAGVTQAPPMRIVQMLSCGMNNGAARHCLALSQGLAERGHDVLLLHRQWLESNDAVAAGVRCVESTFKRTPGELRRVGEIVAAHGAQVVHTHMSSANAFGVVQRLLGGPPVVATAHARHLQLHWAFNDLVIAPTDAAAAYHRRVNLVPRRRLVVIPSTLGAQRPPLSAERRANARRMMGVPEDALVIGLIGDIVIEKRQSDLVLAARPLLATRPEAVVALVGKEFHAGEVRRLNAASVGIEDRVLRFGRREDAADFLAGFDLFALSSVKEEIPLVLVEAMAAGLAVVSTTVGRAPELLEDGRSGFLVRPGDVTAMAERLQRLAADPELRARFGDAARERALAELDPGPIVARVEAALARVVATATPARRRALDTSAQPSDPSPA